MVVSPATVLVADGTDPLDSTDDLLDSDGDGLTDTLELSLGSNPYDTESDGDGISDAHEYSIGTDPGSADSDNDGLDDDVELGDNQVYDVGTETDPTDPDTDDDGVKDGTEVCRAGIHLTPTLMAMVWMTGPSATSAPHRCWKTVMVMACQIMLRLSLAGIQPTQIWTRMD